MYKHLAAFQAIGDRVENLKLVADKYIKFKMKIQELLHEMCILFCRITRIRFFRLQAGK